MAAECKVIVVGSESDLGSALGAAGGESIVLLCGGVRFRVVQNKVATFADPNDIWANYDPEGIRQGLREIAGIITPEEAERIKQMICRGREEGTRPIDRPGFPQQMDRSVDDAP